MMETKIVDDLSTKVTYSESFDVVKEFSQLHPPIPLHMKSVFLVFFFFLFSLVLTGQNISLLQEIKQDSAVDLYLALDWKELEKNKKEKAFCPAKVNLETLDGDSVTMDAKVRTRGHMRLDICSFPPIKLKFDKSDLKIYSS